MDYQDSEITKYSRSVLAHQRNDLMIASERHSPLTNGSKALDLGFVELEFVCISKQVTKAEEI